MASTTVTPVYDFDENGNLVYTKTVDMELWKECPNCYAVFMKKDNSHYVRNNNGPIVALFYRCPVCACRITCKYVKMR